MDKLGVLYECMKTMGLFSGPRGPLHCVSSTGFLAHMCEVMVCLFCLGAMEVAWSQ